MKTSLSRLLIFVIALGLGMGVAFGAGITYDRSSTPKAAAAETTRTSGTGGGGFGGQAGNGGAGRPAVVGVVGSLDNGSFVVAPLGNQGVPTKVAVSDKTTVQKNVTGAISDLKNGDRVTVTGDRGADGNVAASTIQILPSAQGAQ